LREREEGHANLEVDRFTFEFKDYLNSRIYGKSLFIRKKMPIAQSSTFNLWSPIPNFVI
jgi:hypothetical protein